MKKTPTIEVARAYELPKKAAGFRVLVDRLWPRGVKKSELKLDAWLKDVAPSTELRKWFHADPESRFSEFKKRYTAELRQQDSAQLKSLLDLVGEKPILLLYGTRDEKHSHAIVLREYLLKQAAVQRKKGRSSL